MADDNNDKKHFSLISIGSGKIGEAVKVLIEKASKGLGDSAAPFLAQQRAKAEIIEAKAHIEKRELAARAGGRFIAQEMRKQENIEQIIAQTAEKIKDADPENVRKMDDDWIAHFFDNCSTISNKKMQDLWADILAREATAPGAISPRTVSIVRNFSKEDAETLTFFGQFVWHCEEPDNPNTAFLLIYADQWSWYKKQQLKIFELMKHLTDIGIISYQPSTPYTYQYPAGNKVPFFYHKRAWLVQLTPSTKGDMPFMNVGNTLFTQAGRQLYSICEARPNEEFLQFILARWKKEGLNPTPIPYPGK